MVPRMSRHAMAFIALLVMAPLTLRQAQGQPEQGRGLKGRPTATGQGAAFSVYEAAVSDIQRAIQSKRITTVGVVEQYLRRIKAYNGTCVNEPQGILGPVTTIANAGQINALATLNLRPAAREKWGFDARKARSMTDRADGAADMQIGRASCRERVESAPVAEP